MAVYPIQKPLFMGLLSFLSPLNNFPLNTANMIPLLIKGAKMLKKRKQKNKKPMAKLFSPENFQKAVNFTRTASKAIKAGKAAIKPQPRLKVKPVLPPPPKTTFNILGMEIPKTGAYVGGSLLLLTTVGVIAHKMAKR